MLTVLATEILHLIVGTERVVHVRKHKIMEMMSCFLFLKVGHLQGVKL